MMQNKEEKITFAQVLNCYKKTTILIKGGKNHKYKVKLLG